MTFADHQPRPRARTRKQVNGKERPIQVPAQPPPDESPDMPSLEVSFVALREQFLASKEANVETHRRAQEDRDRMERTQAEMKGDIKTILETLQQQKGVKSANVRTMDVFLIALGIASPVIIHFLFKIP